MQALGLFVVGVFIFVVLFGLLWVMKVLWGIWVESEVEIVGLDVFEYGMWGYFEFYILVLGGYGTELYGYLGFIYVQWLVFVPMFVAVVTIDVVVVIELLI